MIPPAAKQDGGGERRGTLQPITFQVPGKPQGKARARTVYNKNLKHSVSYTPEGDLLYENFIKTMYIQAAQGRKFEDDVPITLKITAHFLPAKSTSKKKQQQMLSGELYPLKKPDMDNIVKVVADALNVLAYHDDTQIVYVEAKKEYSVLEGLDITIEEFRKGK